MSAPEDSVSRKKLDLERKIEKKRNSLDGYKKYINPKDDEIISVLEAKRSKKEEELKKCYWNQCIAIFLKKKLLLSIDYDKIKIFFSIMCHSSICSLFVFIDWAKRFVFKILL